MKIKLQFAVFISLLVFLGTYLERYTAQNQQIVIQFTDANISSEDANRTIEIVKKQLESLGVTNIQIGQHESGKLKITYYSISAIEHIQNVLSLEDKLQFNYESEQNNPNNLPVNRNAKDYELNISEIHNNSDFDWNLEAIQIAQINHKSDRYDNPKVKIVSGYLNLKYRNDVFNVAIKVNKTISLSLEREFGKIPHVRAGPIYNGLV